MSRYLTCTMTPSLFSTKAFPKEYVFLWEFSEGVSSTREKSRSFGYFTRTSQHGKTRRTEDKRRVNMAIWLEEEGIFSVGESWNIHVSSISPVGDYFWRG